ncbi:MAG: hypothetical protein ACPGQS_04680 [Bradymonadia bacterium]
MPLTYQGAVSKKLPRNLGAAREHAHALLHSVGYQKTDIRLVFESLDALKETQASFPEKKTLWLDLSVHPTDALFASAHRIVMNHQSFRVSIIGAGRDADVEISLDREQAFTRRFDDRLCYENEHNDSTLLRIQSPAGRVSNAADQRTIDAQLHRFHDIIRAYLPESQQQDLVFKGPPSDAVTNQWFEVAPEALSPLETPSYTQQEYQSFVSSLSIRVANNDQESLARLWMACINELVRPRVCHLRISGTIEELAEVHRCVDLYHEHPWSITQGYGLLVEGVESGSECQNDGLTSLLKTMRAPTSSWDLRLRANWGMDLSTDTASMLGGSRYIIRSAKQQSLDQLFVELPFDNPDGADFRTTQMHLAAHIDDSLAKRNAWQYEGPRVDAPQGQRHLKLVKALEMGVTTLESTDPAFYPPKAEAPGILTTLLAGFRRTGHPKLSFTEIFERSLAQHMPGFRYDQRAHVSDDYFVEFYRPHKFGFDLIQVQRMRNPERFKLLLGVSQLKIYIDDLIPTKNRVSPGIILDFSSVLPDGWANEYYQFTSQNLTRSIDSATAHLVHFGKPFFDMAHAILPSHQIAMKEEK